MSDVAQRVRYILKIDIATELTDQILHHASIFSLKLLYSWRPSTLMIDTNRKKKQILKPNNGKTYEIFFKTIRMETN